MNTYDKIYTIVSQIPSGQVLSYGEVARQVGFYRGARMVGWALGCLPPDTQIPWQRVVNKQGMISIRNPAFPPERQKVLLENEGVMIEDREGQYFVKPDFMPINNT